MDSIAKTDIHNQKPHAVCVPFPSQGHINPMFKLAKLLHSKGFHITFVNTEFNQRRLLKSSSEALVGFPDFRFATIPDGLPPSDPDATQDIPSLFESTTKTCVEPLCDLLTELKNNSISTSDAPPVSCIVSDGEIGFTFEAAERFELPLILFGTSSACGVWGYTQFSNLVEKGYSPLQDVSQLTNGYLDTVIDGIPGIMNNIRLRDIPCEIRTTDPEDFMLNFIIQGTEVLPRAKALILNTFDALEQDVINVLSAMFRKKIYTLGPLHLMTNHHTNDNSLDSISSSLWKEDLDCIKWLDTKEPESVVYVNFGSITVVTAEQLTEFAWGLANSKKTFLWIIRPDMVVGDSAMLPPEFVEETKDRCKMVGWCPQEQVLSHPAIGVFLTHSGWNSTIESIASGVPMICWPFFGEQTTNCRFSCVEWGVGMEIDNDVKRDEVEMQVKEMMDGEKGKKMKAKVVEWKKKAEEAVALGGPSCLNLDKLIKEVLRQ